MDPENVLRGQAPKLLLGITGTGLLLWLRLSAALTAFPPPLRSRGALRPQQAPGASTDLQNQGRGRDTQQTETTPLWPERAPVSQEEERSPAPRHGPPRQARRERSVRVRVRVHACVRVRARPPSGADGQGGAHTPRGTHQLPRGAESTAVEETTTRRKTPSARRRARVVRAISFFLLFPSPVIYLVILQTLKLFKRRPVWLSS